MAEKTQERIPEAEPPAPRLVPEPRPEREKPPGVTSDAAFARRAPAGGAAEPPPAEALPLLAEPSFRMPRHDVARGRLLGQLQRRYGNRAVERLLPASRGGEAREAPPDIEQHVDRSRGQGHPLPQPVRGRMEEGFGRDLSAVRVHSDSQAGKASRALGAEAFTSGRDVYFGQGRYQPGSGPGQHLLAHELAHTVQQGSAPPLKAKLLVGSSDDPREREAEAAADRIVRGKAVDTPREAADETPLRRSDGDPPAGGAGGESESGADLVIKLGPDIRIPAAELGRGARTQIDLQRRPERVPGLKLRRLVYRPQAKRGEIQATVDVPFIEEAPLRFDVADDGRVSFRGPAKLPVRVGALGHPELSLSLDASNQVAAQMSLGARQLKPSGIPNLQVEGGGEVRLARGKLAGTTRVNLKYPHLAKGNFELTFAEGTPRGSGKVEITQKFLQGASADLAVEEGDLKADVTVPASKIAPPVPGLAVPEGSLQVGMQNGVLSGSITGLRLVYRELGEATLSGTINRGVATGTGELVINIPALEPIRGSVGYTGGKLHGEATVAASDFPDSLPVESGSITAALDEKGEASFDGKVNIALGNVARGELRGAYKENRVDLGADVQLRVPGLQEVTARVDYVAGELEGEIDVPIATDKLEGLSGNVHVEYRQKKWQGESTLGYERDNGKLTGEATIGVAQKEDGSLAVHGSGDVTAQLTSFLAGQLHLEVKEDGTVEISGAIRVTEPLELFSEKKVDQELFSVSHNIPVFAGIVVVVIRLRAGVRAGVGPGQLRDIAIEGEYVVGAESLPAFTLSGELFIPAFAEAYLAIGAGLGVDIVLGSLTGGIEAIATAGIYGAVSVIPEIAYRDGNYSITGTATMAAGAKIKLGLQAWAELEALWITIWEQTWQLAEWVWDVGPNLALQAQMSYTFGQDEAPSFDFKTDDIDADRLVNDAMPKDGPKGSGAREALKNRAEWSGRTKGKGKNADKAPEPKTKAVAPKAPPKPSRKAKPTGKDLAAKRPPKEKGAQSTSKLAETIEKAAKEQEKKGEAKALKPDQVPAFPPPSAQEIEINWANYLEETKGRGIEERVFVGKMRAGEVYHPKLRRFTTLQEDYLKAYATLRENEKSAGYFASKMRGGYYAGSLLPDSAYDPALETPVPDGEENPYPIHWPTQFLVSGFESFTVAGGVRVRPSPRKEYSVESEGQVRSVTFGVEGTFPQMMSVGTKLKRQIPGRNASRTASEWDRWRRVGFQGGGATAETVTLPALHKRSPDASLFRNHNLPDGTPTTNGETYGQYIDNDPSFAAYQGLSGVERDRFRAAARAGTFDIMNMQDVSAYVDYLKAKTTADQSQRGVSGYEMQHVMPLFLVGPSADKPENLWPLSVSQHREGHRILANQPQLKEWGAPTHDLESTKLMDKYFVVRTHGSSL